MKSSGRSRSLRRVCPGPPRCSVWPWRCRSLYRARFIDIPARLLVREPVAEAFIEYRLQFQLRPFHAYVQLVAEAMFMDGEITLKMVQFFSRGDSLVRKAQAVTQYVSKRGRDGMEMAPNAGSLPLSSGFRVLMRYYFLTKTPSTGPRGLRPGRGT